VLRQAGLEGALIFRVAPGSGADQADLHGTRRLPFGRWQLGDDEALLTIVTSANAADLFLALEPKKAGDAVDLDLVRDGRRAKARVVLGDSGDAEGAERGRLQ